MDEILYVSNSTTLSFKSLLGYATSDETARVQVSTDGGGSWADLFTEAGTNGAGETAFTQHSISLGAYAGKSAQLRFNFDLAEGGYYYPYSDNYVGWCIEGIAVTNSQKLLNLTTNTTASTNFNFVPTQTGSYLLQTRGMIFTDYPTDIGTAKTVTAVAGPPVITLNAPTLAGNQVSIKFQLNSGSATSFHLLQASQLGGAWTTNGSAVLGTNVAGSSYTFTTTNGPAVRFYRIETP
jgi:hypothetical protein